MDGTLAIDIGAATASLIFPAVLRQRLMFNPEKTKFA